MCKETFKTDLCIQTTQKILWVDASLDTPCKIFLFLCIQIRYKEVLVVSGNTLYLTYPYAEKTESRRVYQVPDTTDYSEVLPVSSDTLYITYLYA